MTQTKQRGYSKNSAGQLMTSQVPIVPAQATVGDIQKILFERAGVFETINYIYLTDTVGVLKGVVSIRELFGAPNETPALKLSPKSVVTARVHTDQERVVLLALKHNIKSIPIVDKQGVFLGVVPSDIILNILHSENGDCPQYSVPNIAYHVPNITTSPERTCCLGDAWIPIHSSCSRFSAQKVRGSLLFVVVGFI